MAKPNSATRTMAVAIAIRLQTTWQQTPIAIGAETVGSETNKVEESQTAKMGRLKNFSCHILIS